MPAVTGHIGVLKNSLVSIEAVDYANQLTRARLVPETPSTTLRTLVPDGSITDVDSPVWTFEIAGVQKQATGGLASVLNAATPGDLLDVIWEPVAALVGQPHYVFQVVAKPVPVGGDQGGQALFEAVLEVIGAPVKSLISA
jgi:hypothetical protein